MVAIFKERTTLSFLLQAQTATNTSNSILVFSQWISYYYNYFVAVWGRKRKESTIAYFLISLKFVVPCFFEHLNNHFFSCCKSECVAIILSITQLPVSSGMPSLFQARRVQRELLRDRPNKNARSWKSPVAAKFRLGVKVDFSRRIGCCNCSLSMIKILRAVQEAGQCCNKLHRKKGFS